MILFAVGTDSRDGPATRRRIMDTVEAQGALHKSALMEETGLGWGTVTHHLRVLEDEGALQTLRHGRRTVVHAPGIPLEQVHWLMTLSRPETRGIVESLEREPGMDPRRLGEETGRSPRTVRRHLAHLEEVGMVHRDATDPARFETDPGVLDRLRAETVRTWRRIGGRWVRNGD